MSVFSEVSTTDLVTQIARQITEAIVTGHLKPGERLTELQLSREFGTSRAPVREAARLLESQGLVTFSPRRGFFVRTFSASEMRDIYELRIGLELHAGYLAVERATDADIAALEKQLGRLYGTAGQASIETQIFEDFAFHRMICKASGNARLIRVYDELATEMRAGITLIGKIYDDPQRMAETHEPIMDALRKRDGDELREALRYHIAVARDAVVALFEELEKGV
ncbi:GntR family transcriptional regulator (plasmid) [Nitratireductor sp. L1-7-SE]|uniref:GntR family transcriptional regulator n=1 Tax=Nitratireductor rhodophyticola TaxID=2854036 RepID=A0ABS7RCJ5_9HYPH|nr:GntR family transcriptional regulator [Nitratireductor rhodophyticola]MBY8918369.1 GntR family transcriptional regulator [Nitratireductor rhodophyticola]MBY8922712.1 GntR family transcriptional regulator [Nitratireductor rhodophyticola]